MISADLIAVGVAVIFFYFAGYYHGWSDRNPKTNPLKER